MQHSTSAPNQGEASRIERMMALGCVACAQLGVFLLRHALTHGHGWIAANILYTLVAIRLRHTFMPERARRMDQERAQFIRIARHRRRLHER